MFKGESSVPSSVIKEIFVKNIADRSADVGFGDVRAPAARLLSPLGYCGAFWV